MKFQPRVGASGLAVADLVGLYAEIADVVIPIAIPRTAPDPDDDVVLGTAIAATVDYVVTGDRALLSVTEFRGVRIASVRDVLDEIEAL